MRKKSFVSAFLITLMLLGASFTYASSNRIVGVVNFATCATESKYGKFEQEQFEKIKVQWQNLIQETDKELSSLSEKFKDQDYMDGLSPDAEDEMKLKYKTLNEDLMKYQNQLYQSLNQANYVFMQKMTKNISEASEQVAKQKKLDLIMTKEACFYHKPDMEITSLVIKEMDKRFEKDKKNLVENKEAEKTENAKK